MKNALLFILTVISVSVYSQNSLKSSITELHNGSTWINSEGMDYEYDVNEKLISQTYYSWDGTNYKVFSKKTYTYNLDDQLIEEVLMFWDDNTNQYEKLERFTFSYNSSGQLIEFIIFTPYGTGWIETSKQEITYFNSQIAQIEGSYPNGNQWNIDNKLVLYYLGNKLIQADGSQFDGSQWNDNHRFILLHDANDKIKTVKYEYYDDSVWTEYNKIDYNLDANYNLISKYVNDFFPSRYIVEYDYDFTDQMTNYAHPFISSEPISYLFEDFPYENKVLSETTLKYDTIISDYLDYKKVTYNYNNQLVLSTENNQKTPKISLYPNPSNDFIQIKGITKPENVSVYTVLGMKVFDTFLKENDKLNIQTLNNGLYLLKFEDGTALKFLKK